MRTWTTKSGYLIIRILTGRSNVFLLTNGKINFLIDTSVGRLWNKLQKNLAKAGITKIDYLVLSHAHFDHAANANKIRAKYHASVIVHNSEAVLLSQGENVIPRGTTLLTRALMYLAGKQAFKLLAYEPCQADIPVNDLLELFPMGINARIMHTPGHTPGSLSVVVEDEIALVGDAMFGVFRGSVFPPYALNTDLMVQSWGKLLKTGCRLFIPSHGTENQRSLVEKEYNRRRVDY